jgi:hypothetical protein
MIPSFILSFVVERVANLLEYGGVSNPPHAILLDLHLESGILWGARGKSLHYAEVAE